MTTTDRRFHETFDVVDDDGFHVGFVTPCRSGDGVRYRADSYRFGPLVRTLPDGDRTGYWPTRAAAEAAVRRAAR